MASTQPALEARKAIIDLPDTTTSRAKFTQEGLIIVVERMCLLDVLSESADAKVRLRTINVNDDDVQQRVAVAMDEYASATAEGIFTKPFILANAKTMPPASWWANYGKHVPAIATIVQRVLSQPVWASAAERNWSIYGQIKFDDRNRLGHEVTDKLVYCHETIHLREKLQKAGYIN